MDCYHKAKKRTQILKQIEAAISKLNLSIAHTVVRDLQAFPEADQQGTVVLRVSGESKSNTKAKHDLLALFSEIVNLKIKTLANE